MVIVCSSLFLWRCLRKEEEEKAVPIATKMSRQNRGETAASGKQYDHEVINHTASFIAGVSRKALDAVRFLHSRKVD